LRGLFGAPNNSDDLVQPVDDGWTAVREHFCSDEADACGLAILQSFDSVGRVGGGSSSGEPTGSTESRSAWLIYMSVLRSGVCWIMLRVVF